MVRRFNPPPTKFGASGVAQALPAVAATGQMHKAPPTRFGPDTAQAKMAAAAAPVHLPPPTKFSPGDTAQCTGLPKAGGRGNHAPPPTRYGPGMPAQRLASRWHGTPRVLQRAEAEKKEAHPAEIFAEFVAQKMAEHFVYNPDTNNCLTLARGLIEYFKSHGLSGTQADLIGVGKRFIIRTPKLIDTSYEGGAVIHDSSRLPGLTAFENHHGVLLNGVVYDPTGGYVGPQDDWAAILTEADIEPMSGRDLMDMLPCYKITHDISLPEEWAFTKENEERIIFTYLVKEEVLKSAVVYEAAEEEEHA